MLKKIAFGAVGIILLASPILVSAQASTSTVSDLQAQISALVAKVRELQLQLLTLQLASSTPSNSLPPGLAKRCLHMTRAIGFGHRGDDVGELQKFLIDEGHLPQGLATGFFGSATEQALKKFQAAHGVVATGTPWTTGWGLLGPATRALLLKFCAKPPGPISCPVYTPRPCEADEVLVGGRMLPNGCQAAPRCVRKDDLDKNDKKDGPKDDTHPATASTTPPAPVILSFSLSSTTIPLGGTVTANWQTSGAMSCVLYGPSSEKRNADDVATSGPMTLTLSQKESEFERGKKATITLVCFGASPDDGKHPASTATSSVVLLTSASGPSALGAPTCKLAADKATVEKDKKVKLTWSSTNAMRAAWANGDAADLYGRKDFALATTTTFSLSFFGTGTTTCSTTVSVEPGKPKHEVSDAGTLSNLASVLTALEAGLNSLLESLGL